MKKLYFTILLLVFLGAGSLCLKAENNVFTVEVESLGPSYELAIANALCEAIHQVNGVRMDTQQKLASIMSEAVIFTADGEPQKITLNQMSTDQFTLLTKGAVKSYRITSYKKDDDGTWHVSMSVDINQYESPDPDAARLRRIAMSPFKSGESVFQIGGITVAASKISEELLSDFNLNFTQSRRFAVLSRQDDAALAHEKQIISASSPVAEAAKLGQTLGLDYLVTGTVKNLYISKPTVQTIAVSGAQILTLERALIDVEYRIVVVATSQIKWTDRITVDLSQEEINAYGCDAETLYHVLMAYASQGIAKAVDDIYPMRAVSCLENGEVVLDRGGNLLAEGMYFDAFKLGDMLYDPVTNAPLGQPEIKIAVVQIMRVDPRMSYCRAVPGYGQITQQDIEKGVILRAYREAFPTPEEQAAQQAAAAAAAQQQAPAPIPAKPVIRLPFDN